MREPSDTKDCTKHYGNILAGFVCDALLKAPVKQYYVLEWEWQPQVNWPGNETWINDIDGYRIFEIDPLSKKEKLIANVSNPKQKVVAVPLPWGAPCYGVKAYIDDPVLEPSQMATYCPGKPPTPQKITLEPVDWLTTGGTWIDDGDCDGYGGLSHYDSMKQIRSNYGQQPGDVVVGSYIVDDDEDDCYQEGNYTGGVKFSTQLPMSAIVHKAVLRFSNLSMDYYATGLAAPKPSSCVAGIGKAKQDWSNAVPANHYSSYISLSSLAYNTPVQTLSAFMANEVDVTSLVNDWVNQPEKNFGLILSPAKAPYPLDDGSGTCMSGLQNIKLDVYYFAPP